LRRTPFCVVLLDEVEKAHPDVFNLFLQVFDDGRLTDSKGRTVDATNALFVLISSLACKSGAGFRAEAGEARKGALLAEVRKAFRPEFLNRLDDVVVFRPRAREHMKRIARLRSAHYASSRPEMTRDSAILRLFRLRYSLFIRATR
jgi:ATP-dependent Clp protease ATP-binding subunit ClpA